MSNSDLARARRTLCGHKIVSVDLGATEGGGVILTLDNGTVISAGVRDPDDEEGAVNGYAALSVLSKRSTFSLG